MCVVVVKGTQPNNFQRLAIIFVVALTVLISTNFTWQSYHFPDSNSILTFILGTGFFFIAMTPCAPAFVRFLPSMREFSPHPFIFPKRFRVALSVYFTLFENTRLTSCKFAGLFYRIVIKLRNRFLHFTFGAYFHAPS